METKPLKIGIDGRLWSETGVGRYIRNLVFALIENDQTNHYVVFLTKKNFETVSFSHPNFQKRLADIPWHSLKEQVLFPRLLEKEHLDLMHFPYFSMPIFYRRKFVVTIHDLIIKHFSTGKASTLPAWLYQLKLLGYTLIMQVAALRAQKIIAVSETTRQEVIDHLHVPSKKIIVTYEGADDALRDGIEAISDELPPSDYFLSVGNAYPHKNIEGLIRAFEEFKKREKGNCQLILVGRDDYFYERLREQLSEEQKQYILFLNNVSDASLRALYMHCKALIFVSLMEGFGLPVLEALSLGKRVIVSDISVMHEVCGDVGLYVDPTDTNAIAEMIQTVYTLSNDTSYEKKAIEQTKQFSWKKMAQQTKQIYESCFSLRQS